MSNIVGGIGPGSSIGSIGSMPAQPIGGAGEPDGSFGGILTDALQHVDHLNTNAQQQIANVLQGGNSDLSSVMVAVEKADVAFQLMMQVRNKIVNAYQDIEKMQF